MVCSHRHLHYAVTKSCSSATYLSVYLIFQNRAVSWLLWLQFRHCRRFLPSVSFSIGIALVFSLHSVESISYLTLLFVMFPALFRTLMIGRLNICFSSFWFAFLLSPPWSPACFLFSDRFFVALLFHPLTAVFSQRHWQILFH